MTDPKFKIALVAALFLSSLTVQGCSQSHSAADKPTPSEKTGTIANDQAAAQSKTHTKHIPTYRKPGPAVDFVHDYDGFTAPGTVETIQVSIHHNYSGGTLSLVAIPSDDTLSIINAPSPQAANLKPGQALHYTFEVKPQTTGTSLLNLLTTIALPDGQSMQRSYAIRINSDATQQNQKSRIDQSAPAKSNTTIKEMPAQEVIIRP